MAVDQFMMENAGAVNRMESLRRWLLADCYGLPGLRNPAQSGSFAECLAFPSGSVFAVGPGSVAVADTDKTHGFWLWSADTGQSVTIPNSGPSNPSRHGVFARVNDSSYSYGDSSNTMTLGFVTASGAGPPAVTYPPGTEPLWEIIMPAAATSLSSATFIDKRRPAGLGQTFADLTRTVAMPSGFTDGNTILIPFDTRTVDWGTGVNPPTGAGNATTGATSAYTCPQTGSYDIDGGAVVALAQVRQRCLLHIYRNGALARTLDDKFYVAGTGSVVGTSGDQCSVGGSTKLYCAAGDVISLRFNPSGSAGAAVSLYTARMTIQRVG